MQWRAEALLVTLAHTLAEMESEKFGDRVADVEGVAYTIRRLKVNTLVDSEMSPIFFPRFSRSKFIDSLPGLFRIARILVKTILIIGLLG